MTRLTIVIPTRNRPHSADAILTACESTCTTNPRIILAVDSTETRLDEYQNVAAARAIVHIVQPPRGHVRAINSAALQAVLHGTHAVVKLDDDHRPRDPGWDASYLAALDQLGVGVVYGNDLLQGQRLPTAPGISAQIISALGYMAPPVLGHLYCDNFWHDLGASADCLRYLPDVTVEHLHPGAGKARWDADYERVNSAQRRAGDARAYRTYCATDMRAAVATVRDLRSAP